MATVPMFVAVGVWYRQLATVPMHWPPEDAIKPWRGSLCEVPRPRVPSLSTLNGACLVTKVGTPPARYT